MCEHAYYGDELLEPPAATSQEPACEPLQKLVRIKESITRLRRILAEWHAAGIASCAQWDPKKSTFPVPKTGPALVPKAGTKNDTILGP